MGKSCHGGGAMNSRKGQTWTQTHIVRLYIEEEMPSIYARGGD